MLACNETFPSALRLGWCGAVWCDGRHGRVAAAVHPGSAVATVEALAADDDATGPRAATNSATLVARQIELLSSTAPALPALAMGAAGKWSLPDSVVGWILDRAGL